MIPISEFVRVVEEVTKCAWCLRQKGRRSIGVGRNAIPEPYNPAIHCDGKCGPGANHSTEQGQ